MARFLNSDQEAYLKELGEKAGRTGRDTAGWKAITKKFHKRFPGLEVGWAKLRWHYYKYLHQSTRRVIPKGNGIFPKLRAGLEQVELENQKLRDKVAQLETENAQLRSERRMYVPFIAAARRLRGRDVTAEPAGKK